MELTKASVWNAIHTAEILSTEEAGLQLKIGDIQAFLPKDELLFLDGSLGEQVEIYLENPQNPIASILKARELREIESVQKALEANEVIEGIVIGPIKGGFSVALAVNTRESAERGAGLRAFLPFSHVGLDTRMVPALSDREPYAFKIKEFKPVEGNIIVSRRSLLQKERKEQEKAFWESIQIGDVVSGIVKSLVAYGAFVELAGTDALLHVSDMSFEQHPLERDQVKVGQALRVMILELDKKAKKVKVGLKQLKKDPWQAIEDEYKVGMDITGTVVAFSDFGIFVRLADGLEGLVHSSEISWQRPKHPSSYYKIGDKVNARILKLDKEGHRISLSIKALQGNPVDQLVEKYPVGTVLKASIVGIKDYGVFVKLDDQVTGMVHIGELSWTKNIRHPSDMFKEGEEIDVAVMGFDPKRQRVSCSVKRIYPDPWIEWKNRYHKGSRHEVTVKRVSPNGFECELESELVAYCSSRELGDATAKVGQKLNVEVIACDPIQHKVTISVKARVHHEAREDYDAYLKRSQNQNARATLGDALGNIEIR